MLLRILNVIPVKIRLLSTASLHFSRDLLHDSILFLKTLNIVTVWLFYVKFGFGASLNSSMRFPWLLFHEECVNIQLLWPYCPSFLLSQCWFLKWAVLGMVKQHSPCSDTFGCCYYPRSKEYGLCPFLKEVCLLFQSWFTPRYLVIRNTAKPYRALVRTGKVGINIFCGPVHALNMLYNKEA